MNLQIIKQAAFENELIKIADEADIQIDPKSIEFAKKRFDKITQLLNNSGVYAGTDHKRLVIPKEKFTESDMAAVGFIKSIIAVPEAGQDMFASFRNTDNNYHIHSHPGTWTIHEDRHASSQMLAAKADKIKDKLIAYIQGLPHLLTEGVPGSINYTKNIGKKDASTATNVLNELPKNIVNNIDRWIPSKTIQIENEKFASFYEYGLLNELEKMSELEKTAFIGNLLRPAVSAIRPSVMGAIRPAIKGAREAMQPLATAASYHAGQFKAAVQPGRKLSHTISSLGQAAKGAVTDTRFHELIGQAGETARQLLNPNPFIGA